MSRKGEEVRRGGVQGEFSIILGSVHHYQVLTTYWQSQQAFNKAIAKDHASP